LKRSWSLLASRNSQIHRSSASEAENVGPLLEAKTISALPRAHVWKAVSTTRSSAEHVVDKIKQHKYSVVVLLISSPPPAFFQRAVLFHRTRANR
jgi:hypothetical protein